MCSCGEPKGSRSTMCLACYRKTMIARNVDQAGAMALARETATGKRRSKLELAAEELFKAMGLAFTTSFPIGRFVADFYLPDYRAVVECYGPHHRWLEANRERDKRRERTIREAGLRFVVLSDLDMHLWWKLLQDGLSTSGTSVCRVSTASLRMA